MALGILSNYTGRWLEQAWRYTDYGKRLYADYPNPTRVVVTTLSLPEAIMHVPLFPVEMLVGSVALPIIGAVRCCMGKKGAVDWFIAGGFCVLGVAATIAFVTLTACIPFMWTLAILASATVISIIVHTKEACKLPSPVQL